MPRKPLTLSRAIKTKRIRDFVEQQEAAGIVEADEAVLLATLAETIKQPLPNVEHCVPHLAVVSGGNKTR